MTIEIDKYAGFCWGVVRAIDFAENVLNSGGELYSLGDIIHNKSEVDRLSNLGLKIIAVSDFPKLPERSKVLIRAHGEPPSTYSEALKYKIELVDATCPVVTKVQERIRKFVEKEFQIVIFGKKDHAEVVGLNGVTGGTAIVILSVQEALEKVKFEKKTVLFSQTTMDRPTFYQIADTLRGRIKEFEVGTVEETATEFLAKDTICGQVSGREKKLREFGKNLDVIIFSSGRKSSNGKVLYSIVKEENEKSYFIENKDEIDWGWFDGCNSVGITGATSTPKWAMEEIRDLLNNKFN